MLAWGNPEKGRLGCSSAPGSQAILESRAALIYTPLVVDLKAIPASTLGDTGKEGSEKSVANVKLQNVASLQITLKNLPKSMQIHSIYSQDHNLGNMFDGIVSRHLSKWRSTCEEAMKYKVYLSTFLHLLFKLNKER